MAAQNVHGLFDNLGRLHRSGGIAGEQKIGQTRQVIESALRVT
jgi:hypothetical protein